MTGLRHPVEARTAEWICPITGTFFRDTWTDHSLKGCYNKCDQCFPEEFVPLGKRLAALDESRRE